ncbi:hypothetical protein [Streptomyces sp. NPDC093568]|uniref:hypothetical protein n=1 Tax=Streptomyces sp. NPDC093568 TaxID=3366041 RepID=UPI00381A0AA1
MVPLTLGRSARRPQAFRLLSSLCLGATALALLTACSQSDGTGPGVVSVPAATSDATSSSGAEASSPTTDAVGDSGRPQLRLDTSDEERVRLSNAWSACMHKNGVDYQSVVKDGIHVPDNTDPDFAAAGRKCLSKAPLPPPELSPETNPRYLDDYREQIDCLHEHGLMVEALPDGGGYNYPAGPMPPNSRDIEDRCVLEAFGER